MKTSFNLLVTAVFAGISGTTALSLTDSVFCWKQKDCVDPAIKDNSGYEAWITVKDCICQGGKSYSISLGAKADYCKNLEAVAFRRALRDQAIRRLAPAVPFEACDISDPTKCTTYTVECNGQNSGEPHIKQLFGGWYDYHGECDLVFVHAPEFGGGIGLDIHTRTKIRYDYSYIESAAVKIGTDVLQVNSYGEYLINGIGQADVPALLSGYPVTHTKVTDKQHVFLVDIGNENTIAVDTMKDIVSVKIGSDGIYGSEMHDWFGNSTGMLGSLSNPEMLGRDGRVIVEPSVMGQEWQVLDTEPKLFQEPNRPPQYPDKCLLPTSSAKDKRRLLANHVSREDAEKACEHWPEEERDGCIYDVLATSDLELALAGAY